MIDYDLDIPGESIGSILEEIGNVFFFKGLNLNFLSDYSLSFLSVLDFLIYIYYRVIFNIYFKYINILLFIKKPEGKSSIQVENPSRKEITREDSNPLPSPTPSDSISVQQERKYKEELNKENEIVNQQEPINDSEMERR
jgi:hypothetical protein